MNRLCDIGPKAMGAEYDFNKAIPGEIEFRLWTGT